MEQDDSSKSSLKCCFLEVCEVSIGRRNSSDLGVFLSSMPMNWKGRVAIRDLSRRSRGDFQLHDLVDLIPSPCVVFDLAPCS